MEKETKKTFKAYLITIALFIFVFILIFAYLGFFLDKETVSILGNVTDSIENITIGNTTINATEIVENISEKVLNLTNLSE